MPDYSEGKIYKLVNDINDKIYVGSTTNLLRQRLAVHRYDAKSLTRNSPLYSEMRRVGSVHFKISLIEDFPCKSKIELEKREYHIMRRYIRRKVKLLNSMIEFGKRSDEQKKKMSVARKGSLHPNFKRGSLTRSIKRDFVTWIFTWREGGKGHSKSFSVNKYGEKRAKRLAEKVQQAIYPLKTRS